MKDVANIKKTDQIWDEFSDRLKLFIQSKVKDEHLAKDILQDVFIKIHENIDQLKQESKLVSWIYQLTRNTIMDTFRKQKNIVEIEDFEAAEKTENPYIVLESCMEPFLNQLSKSARELLIAVDQQGVSQKVLAAQKGEHYSAFKSKIQRSRQKLKQAFMDCCSVELDAKGRLVGKGSCKNDCGCED